MVVGFVVDVDVDFYLVVWQIEGGFVGGRYCVVGECYVY